MKLSKGMERLGGKCSVNGSTDDGWPMLAQSALMAVSCNAIASR